MGHRLLASRFLTLALACTSLGLLGCGGAAPAPQSTQQPAASSSDLDALERELEASAEQLSVQLQRRADDQVASATPRPAAKDGDSDKKRSISEESGGAPRAPAPSAEAAPAATTPPAPDQAAPDQAAADGACELICRALSSMQRSAGGICSLVGDQHERCLKARQRLELSERQVKEAGCPCSS